MLLLHARYCYFYVFLITGYYIICSPVGLTVLDVFVLYIYIYITNDVVLLCNISLCDSVRTRICYYKGTDCKLVSFSLVENLLCF